MQRRLAPRRLITGRRRTLLQLEHLENRTLPSAAALGSFVGFISMDQGSARVALAAGASVVGPGSLPAATSSVSASGALDDSQAQAAGVNPLVFPTSAVTTATQVTVSAAAETDEGPASFQQDQQVRQTTTVDVDGGLIADSPPNAPGGSSADHNFASSALTGQGLAEPMPSDGGSGNSFNGAAPFQGQSDFRTSPYPLALLGSRTNFVSNESAGHWEFGEMPTGATGPMAESPALLFLLMHDLTDVTVGDAVAAESTDWNSVFGREFFFEGSAAEAEPEAAVRHEHEEMDSADESGESSEDEAVIGPVAVMNGESTDEYIRTLIAARPLLRPSDSSEHQALDAVFAEEIWTERIDKPGVAQAEHRQKDEANAPSLAAVLAALAAALGAYETARRQSCSEEGTSL